MKDLPASVLTQVNADGSQPVILFEFALGDVGTLRFCMAHTNLIFPYPGGNIYTARAFEIDDFAQEENQIGRVSFRTDNTTGEWTSYSNQVSFDGRAIVIKKIYRDALSNATYYNELFNGFLEEPSKIDRNWCYHSAVSGTPLGRQMILDIYQEQCNHMFGDVKCNRDGNSDLTSLTHTGTADAGSTATTLVDNALTQADDYWNFGRIEITIDSETFYRRVKDFDADTDTVTLDVGLPLSISAGDSYTIYKGCDQTWATCKGNNAWGPSADNSANFLGFLHVWRQGSAGNVGAGPSPVSAQEDPKPDIVVPDPISSGPGAPPSGGMPWGGPSWGADAISFGNYNSSGGATDATGWGTIA